MKTSIVPAFLAVGACIACALLAGCVNTTTSSDAPSPTYTAVSVALPEFKPRSGETLEWLGPVLVSGDFSVEVKDWAAEITANRVEGAMSDRGYRFAGERNGDYLLFGAILGGLGEELTPEQRDLIGLLQLYPSLGAAGAPDRNMLVLAVTSREKFGDGNPLWKAAIEMYAADDGELSEDARLQRLENAVQQLVATLPAMAPQN